MRHLLTKALSLLLVLVGCTTVWADDETDALALLPGYWMQIADSNFSDVSCASGAQNCWATITDPDWSPGQNPYAFSGGFEHRANVWHVLWGGGHWDYGGSEIYAFNFNPGAWGWIYVGDYPPNDGLTKEVIQTCDNQDEQAACGGYYLAIDRGDAVNRPKIRHTYNMLAMDNLNNRFFAVGASSTYCDCSGSSFDSVDSFSFATELWTGPGDWALVPWDTQAVWNLPEVDEDTGDIWTIQMRFDHDLWQFKPSTNEWLYRYDGFIRPGDYAQSIDAALDHEQNYFVALGATTYRRVNLNNPGTWTEDCLLGRGLTCIPANQITDCSDNSCYTGNTALVNSDTMSGVTLDYDPNTKLIFGYNVGISQDGVSARTDLFAIHAANNHIVKLKTPSGNTVVPVDDVTNRGSAVQGRFAIITNHPTHGIFASLTYNEGGFVHYLRKIATSKTDTTPPTCVVTNVPSTSGTNDVDLSGVVYGGIEENSQIVAWTATTAANPASAFTVTWKEDGPQTINLPNGTHLVNFFSHDLHGNISLADSHSITVGSQTVLEQIQAMVPGEWLPIVGSSLDDAGVYPPVAPPSTPTDDNCGLFTRSSVVVDTTGNRVLLMGGGGNDGAGCYYAGNEIYAFSLTSFDWSRIWGPTANADIPDTGTVLEYDDGNPSATRVYGNMAYNNDDNELLLWQGCAWKDCSYAGISSIPIKIYDITAGTWSKGTNTLSGSERGGALIYDSPNGKAYLISDTGIDSLDIATGVWTRVKSYSFSIRNFLGAGFNGSEILLVGSGRVYVVAIATWNVVYTKVIDYVGDTDILGGNAPSVMWNSTASEWVLWHGDRQFKNIDPALTWVLNTATQTVQKRYPKANQIRYFDMIDRLGPFGRMVYDANLDRYFMFHKEDDPVFVYRHSTYTGAQAGYGDIDAIQEPVIEAQSHTIRVRWDFDGDENHTAKGELEFKKSSDVTWLDAMDLDRVDWTFLPNQDPSFNTLVGFIARLDAGENYDVRVRIYDTDGGDWTRTVQVSTKPYPTHTPLRTLYVTTGTTGGTGTLLDPYQGLQTAEDAAQPGDLILIRGGSYPAETFSEDGTEGAPIRWMPYEDETVFIAEVNITGSDIWIEDLDVDAAACPGIQVFSGADRYVLKGNRVTGGEQCHFCDNCSPGNCLIGISVASAHHGAIWNNHVEGMQMYPVLQTSGNGAADGSTVVRDMSDYADFPVDYFVSDSGVTNHRWDITIGSETIEVVGFDPTTGTFTMDTPFASQVTTGTDFELVLFSFCGEGVLLNKSANYTRIWRNRIEKTGDALSYPGDFTEIWANYLVDNTDDGFELDYAPFMGAFVFDNCIANTSHNAISYQDFDNGLYWPVFGNMILGYDEAFLKIRGLGQNPIMHNTVAVYDDLIKDGTDQHFMAGLISMNNIYLSYVDGEMIDFVDWRRSWWTRYRNDAMDPRNEPTPFGYGGNSAADLATFKTLSTHAPFTGPLAEGSFVEGRETLVEPFTLGPAPMPAGTFTVQNLLPLAGGGAIDKAYYIPNINDGYIGAGADIGAHELGTTPKTYGPQDLEAPPSPIEPSFEGGIYIE